MNVVMGRMRLKRKKKKNINNKNIVCGFENWIGLDWIKNNISDFINLLLFLID